MKHMAERFEAEMEGLRAAGRPFAVATVVRTVAATSAKPGAKALIDSDGRIVEGWVGGGCARGAVTKAALQAIAEGAPQFVSLRPEELLQEAGVTPGEDRDGVRFARNGCPSRGSMDIFVEPVLPEPELVICGAGPVALALAALSERMGFRRVLCAPGLSGPAPEVEVRRDSFALDSAPGGDRYVVVATQGSGDAAALKTALASGARHVAFVGSRKKFAALRATLIGDGEPAEALDLVRAPAGLDIRAITPDEIALSILAELVMVRRSADRH